MVADEDDDRRFPEPEFAERVEQQADLVVHQGHGGVVGGDRLTLLVVAVQGVVRVADDRRSRNVVAVVDGLVRQRGLRKRVLFEETGGRHPGLVRFVEAGGDEERPVAVVLPQDLDDPARRTAVGRVLFALVGRSPGERQTAGAAVGREDVGARHAVLGAFRPGVVADLRVVDSGKVVVRVPPQGVLGDVPGHRVLVAAVRHLADPGSEVAVIPEVLGQHDGIAYRVARRQEVVKDLGRLGPQAAQEGRPRGVADRVLGVGAVEADALRRQTVEVRRPCGRVGAVAAERDVQVVGDDEQDVVPDGRIGSGRTGEGGEQQDRGDGRSHGFLPCPGGVSRSRQRPAHPGRALPIRSGSPPSGGIPGAVARRSPSRSVPACAG